MGGVWDDRGGCMAVFSRCEPSRNCEHVHAETANTPWWSWGESNPRPSTGGRPRYDHSRVCGSWLPHRRVGWARGPGHGVFPPGQRSFTPSAVCPCGLHCFCCRAAVDWPRVPLPVAVTLYCLTGQAARARSSVLASLLVPRFGSLGNSGRTTRPRNAGVETDQPRGVATVPEGTVAACGRPGARLSRIRSHRVPAGRDGRPAKRGPQRRRRRAMARSASRLASRSAMAWRLSAWPRPRASASSTLARPPEK